MNRPFISASLESRLAGLPLLQAPVFPFPWQGLEDYLARQPEPSLPLIGYGSLLKKASADRTIKEGSPRRSPCLAFGCRRVFNYRMPEAVLQRYGVPPSSPCKAALNVVRTGNVHDLVNGMLITVHVADIPALKQREFGYDLVPVHCVPWEDAEHGPLTAAYILSAPDAAPLPEFQVTDASLLPEPAYARLCVEGAAEVSSAFLEMYLQTTYLADKATPWKP